MHPLVGELLAHEGHEEAKSVMSINRELRGDFMAWLALSKLETPKKRNPLMFSAMIGDTQRTNFLMKIYDPNARCDLGNTALIYALKHRRENVAQNLIRSQKVNVYISNDKSETPLLAAIRSNCFSTIRVMVEEYGLCSFLGALNMCMRYGRQEIFEYLFKYAKEDYFNPGFLGTSNFKFRTYTTVMWAVFLNNIEVLKRLKGSFNDQLSEGSFNDQSSDGTTALMIACQKGHKEIFDYLLERSDASILRNDNYSCLHASVENGFSGLLEPLILKGCPIDALCHPLEEFQESISALHISIEYGDLESMEILLKYGAADVLYFGRNGLAQICSFNNSRLAQYKLFLKYDYKLLTMESLVKCIYTDEQFAIDVCRFESPQKILEICSSDTAMSPLLTCLDHNRYFMAKYLVEEIKIDISKIIFESRDALYIACAENKLDFVCLLTLNAQKHEGHIKPCYSEPSGFTALMHATKNKTIASVRIMRQLLEQGFNPNLKSKKGHTALILACQMNNLQKVKLLVEHGALDLEHKSALQYCDSRKPGGLDCIKYLIENNFT